MVPSDRAITRLSPDDNVAVASRALRPGESLDCGGENLVIQQTVPYGHKVSCAEIRAGEPIRKYGQVIGFASRSIDAGSHVHVQNCRAGRFDRDSGPVTVKTGGSIENPEPRTFRGYLREDGRAGTRNYVAVISMVNCSASVSKYICERFPREILESYPGIDGLLPLTHKSGCGMPFDGPDHRRLNRVVAGFACHPNIGACLLVGLGCEIAQTSHLMSDQRLVQVEGTSAESDREEPAVPVISIQEAGGIAKTVEAGIAALKKLLPRAGAATRTELPASLLVLGTQCGGSDGSSGVTANPALGVAADHIVHQGGTVILGETTEIYGAEHLLARRAIDASVAGALLEKIRWWEWYTGIFGAEIDNNPTPGNKAGGLTTIYEKSLGAIAKAGSTPLVAVHDYAETVTEKGFVVMDTPGYDPVSLTGIVAGGANLCAFTTGRGSVYGCKPSPCLKIATNSVLGERLADDMDIDAGVILDGTPVEEVGRRIFEELLEVASGKPTRSERHGVGEEEFAPWIVGPVL